MKRSFLIIFLGGILFVNAPAQTVRKIKNSSVTFKIKNAGSWVDGNFGKVSGTIKFDEKAANNSIEANIEANTVNTGNGMRDKHLKNEDYFDVEKKPLIKMVSQKITHQSEGNYIGDFSLTLGNTTKTIQIPFSYRNGVFSASFNLNRRDYGIGGKNLILSDQAYIVVVIATE